MISDKTARDILKIYENAWVDQDIDKILSIFAKDATYHEWVLRDQPFKGHQEIAQYWKSKVCDEQSKIEFKLLNYYISGDTLIAEWDAFFNSNVENVRFHIREVAIMKVVNGLIKSLREYWHFENVPLK
jgi:ketosteroid isomerase-like protein